jgi:hypothetical protein
LRAGAVLSLLSVVIGAAMIADLRRRLRAGMTVLSGVRSVRLRVPRSHRLVGTILRPLRSRGAAVILRVLRRLRRLLRLGMPLLMTRRRGGGLGRSRLMLLGMAAARRTMLLLATAGRRSVPVVLRHNGRGEHGDQRSRAQQYVTHL